jgi:hypothetical protein
VSQHGFYSSQRTDQNLRIISLNTNFGYLMNFWIYVDGQDPDNMFLWLIDELQEAEDNGEDVYLMGVRTSAERVVKCSAALLTFGVVVPLVSLAHSARFQRCSPELVEHFFQNRFSL